MVKFIPEAVEAILGQLDRDGMAFQSYKLCGSPYQAVLVMRFTCQKLHLPWMDLAESKKTMMVESTTTASAPSTRSETQDTSYMGMPRFGQHNSKPEAAPWHDSGLDLTASDNHDEASPDRERDKAEELEETPTDEKVSVVCNPLTRSNILPPGSADPALPQGLWSHPEGSNQHTSAVQTDLDFEYMKRLMEEFSSTVYLPTASPFSHMRGSKTSTGSSLTDSLEQETSVVRKPSTKIHRECQTECQVSGVDTTVYPLAANHNSNYANPKETEKNNHQKITSISQRSQGVQANIDHLEVPSALVRSQEQSPRPSVNESIQTELLLESINKAIDTAEYLEKYITDSPSKTTANNVQQLCQETQTEERLFCSAYVNYGAMPEETISIASQDLEIQMDPESDSDMTDSGDIYTSGTIKRNTNFRSFSPEDIQHAEFASQTSFVQTTVDTATDPIIFDTASVQRMVDMSTDPHMSLKDLQDEMCSKIVQETDGSQNVSDSSVSNQSRSSNEGDHTDEGSFDFFAHFLPNSQMNTNKDKPQRIKKLAVDSKFCDKVEYQESCTQTNRPVMITRGVGIRIKQRHSDCQTDQAYPVPDRPQRINPVTQAVQRAQLKAFPKPEVEQPLPNTKKSKKVQRSMSVDGGGKLPGKKKKKDKKGGKISKDLQVPSTSGLSPYDMQRYSAPVLRAQTTKKIYSEEDFKLYVEGLAARSSPEIFLQGGGLLGVVQGVLKLRSGGPDIWVEALYLCVLQELVVPLYCSGNPHKSCMAGQLIDLQLDGWHKDFAIFRAKGSFESANPGMKVFAEAEACCRATMGAKVKSDVVKDSKERKGSQPNKCANQ